MIHHPEHPFQVVDIFFTTLHFSRVSVAPDNVTMDLEFTSLVNTGKLPNRLQVGLRVRSKASEPVSILIEQIALFDLLEGLPVPTQEVVEAFIRERALFMMVPLVRDAIRDTSVSMGMKPVVVPIPYHFDFMLDEGVAEEEE
jgi:hypothetical protein